MGGLLSMRHRGMVAILYLVILIVFSSCGGRTEDTKDDREAIVSMYVRRLEMIQTGATLDQILDAYVAVIADDAVWMPPNAPAVLGKEAINSWAGDFFSQYALKMESLPLDVLEVGAELTIRRFRSVGKYIPSDNSESVPYDQKYIDVLRKGRKNGL